MPWKLTGGLRALEVAEERDLAGRVAGHLYLIGAATVSLLLLVPGVPGEHWAVVLPIGALGALWGICCLLVIPWGRIHPLVSHLSSAMGLPLTVVAMAATGGEDSPARFYLFFVVFYCSYFYPPREAIPYLIGCVIVLLVPLTYDDAAVDGGLLGEILVLAPTFLILGALIMKGKQVMLELTRHDPLTGLVNRRAFEQRLAHAVAGRRQGDSFGLMLCDLDLFKDVNTFHGHPEGDRVLREAAAALLSTVRGGDLVARLGGDEFAIVVNGAVEEAMELLAARVTESLEEADNQLRLPGYSLSASIGWALYPTDASSSDRLVAVADIALREAKALGAGDGGVALRSRPELSPA